MGIQTIPTKPTGTAVDYMTALHLMHQYRAFEKLPLQEGQRLIRHLAPQASEHVCDQWRWKERQWGRFFLNLDNSTRIAFLKHFGVQDPAFESYLRNAEKDHLYQLFADQPPMLQAANNLMMFFENHGMCEETAPGINLAGKTLPSDDKCYGTAGNWADYIISLDAAAKKDLIENILAYYPQRYLG